MFKRIIINIDKIPKLIRIILVRIKVQFQRSNGIKFWKLWNGYIEKNNNHKDTKTFKDEMENSDIKDLLSNDDISITIIA